MNKYDIDYWDKGKVGSIIQLDDTQTLEFLMEQGKQVTEHGADFEVVRIKNFSLNDNSVKIKMFYIQYEDVLWYLVVKILDNEAIVKIYFEPDDFECGNREDLLKAECFYLFEAPENEEDYLAEDLAFATTIDMGDEVFQSDMGAMYGSCFEDGEEDFSTVVELSTESDNDNPDLMIVELSNVNIEEEPDDEGYSTGEVALDINSSDTYVMFLQGCSIQLNDVEILN